MNDMNSLFGEVEAELLRQFKAITPEQLAEDKPYRLLQDNGSKYFGPSWDKADQALDKMAENARELGLDYEPPQRTWVGLTDEEIWGAISRIGTSNSDVNPYAILKDARAIEAKLKEKNT